MQRKKRTPFLAIPYKILLDKNLSDCDKYVFALIISYHDSGKDFYIPADKIGEYIGKSGRSTQMSIKKLLQNGYIVEDTEKHRKSKVYKPSPEYENISYEEE